MNAETMVGVLLDHDEAFLWTQWDKSFRAAYHKNVKEQHSRHRCFDLRDFFDETSGRYAFRRLALPNGLMLVCRGPNENGSGGESFDGYYILGLHLAWQLGPDGLFDCEHQLCQLPVGLSMAEILTAHDQVRNALDQWRASLLERMDRATRGTIVPRIAGLICDYAFGCAHRLPIQLYTTFQQLKPFSH